MSKSPSNDLFTLIQSLTRTEKRYVKQHLLRHIGEANNQSVLLFDALSGKAPYNEEAIKVKNEGSGFVKRMSKAKQELMEQVLIAMRAYHATRTRERRVMLGLLDVEFLLDRGLADLALKRVKVVLELAESLHDHALMLKTLQFMRSVVGELAGPTATDRNLIFKMEQTIRMFSEAIHFESVSTEIANLIRLHGSDVTIARKKADEIVATAKRNGLPQHRNAKMAWLRALSRKALHIDLDPEQALYLDKQRLEIFREDPLFARERFIVFINLLHGVTIRLIITKRFDEAREYRDLLRMQFNNAGGSLTATVQRHVSESYATVELLYAVQTLFEPVTMQFLKQMSDLLDQCEQGQKTEVGIVNRFNIALLYYSIGNRKQSLFSLLDVVEYPKDLRMDIHLGAALMRILLHHELDHPRLVESLIRTLRRNFGKGLADYPDAGILVRTVVQLQASPTPAQQKSIIRKALANVSAVYETQGSFPPTKLFEFTAWCKAQLNRTNWAQEVSA